jgi:SAM-dependent methyltransferase
LINALDVEVGQGSLLDIAPTNTMIGPLRNLAGGLYVGIDLDPSADKRKVQVTADLTELPFPDRSFSAIVCYHVLEHVIDDKSAMSEIARVLASDGIAFIQVPWRPNRATDEDPSVISSEERVQRFGQADHVRYYGDDFEVRLHEAGLRTLRVTPLDFLEESSIKQAGLLAGEDVWLATRKDSGEGQAHLGLKDTVARRMPAALISAWSRSAETTSSAATPEVVKAQSELKRALADLGKAEAKAESWERRYRTLRSRWPVRLMADAAKLGRQLVGRDQTNR